MMFRYDAGVELRTLAKMWNYVDGGPMLHHSLIVVTTTFPDRESAKTVASILVDTRIAACVHIGNDVVSWYRWNDTVHVDHEVVVTIKALPEHHDALYQCVRNFHPYETPQWVVVEATTSADYSAWMRHETRS